VGRRYRSIAGGARRSAATAVRHSAADAGSIVHRAVYIELDARCDKIATVVERERCKYDQLSSTDDASY